MQAVSGQAHARSTWSTVASLCASQRDADAGDRQRQWQPDHDWETTEAAVDMRVRGDVRVVMGNPETGARCSASPAWVSSIRRGASAMPAPRSVAQPPPTRLPG
jgi:hypothetical protein